MRSKFHRTEPIGRPFSTPTMTLAALRTFWFPAVAAMCGLTGRRRVRPAMAIRSRNWKFIRNRNVRLAAWCPLCPDALRRRTTIRVAKVWPTITPRWAIRAGFTGRMMTWGLNPPSDTGGGYDVSWLNTGEWLEYTVNPPDPTAKYSISLRVAAPASRRSTAGAAQRRRAGHSRHYQHRRFSKLADRHLAGSFHDRRHRESGAAVGSNH